MLTGDTPFPGLFETLSPDPAPPASAKRPAHLDPVPVTVERLLEGALAKRAALRFTMDRLRDELARAVEELRAMGRRGSTLKRMGVAVGETPDNYTPRSVARVPGSEPSGRLSPSLSGPRPVIALASPPPRRSPDPEAPLATGRIDPIRGPTRGPQSGPQGGTVDPPDTAPTEKLEMIILPPGAELARLEPNASAPEPVLPVKRAPSANIGTQRMDPLPAAPGKPPLAAPAPPRTETWQVLSPRQAKRLRSRAILALAVAVAGGLGAAGLVWLLRDRKPALRSVPFAAVVPSTAPPDAAAPPPEKPRPAPPPEAASAVAKPEVEPSWSALDPGTTNALFDVWGDARGSVYAVGEAGTILHSTDAGRSFRDLSYQPESGRPPTLYGVWSDGKDVWVVGDRGTILHGRGDAWTVQGRPSATVYYGVWGSSRDDLHIAGNPSTILHSSDGGATWERREAHSGNGLRRVWGSGPRDAWAVGWGETILHSTDGGKSWKLARSGRSTTLFDIWGSSASDVYAVGSLHPPGSRTRSADDAILHTSDGGKHWERQKSGTRYPLYAIGGSGPEDVYAAGPATLLLRSDDGTSWNKVDLDVKRRKVSRIFASGDAIYVVGMGGLMLRRGK
ncbi:MAG: hypothetical protein EXR72_24790 [Myxococcales bacterium]|nr:hypothetical protein [Myxococcales bacterium]